MKKITRLVSIALLAIFIAVGIFGCYGNMSLTKKVYQFNGSVGDKYVQSIVNWAFWACQVYEIAMVLDVFVFNTIEFWTGNNPITLNEGEQMIKYAEGPNGKLKIDITKNRIEISQPENSSAQDNIVLVYDPASSSWTMNNNGNSKKIASMEGNNIKLLSPAGEEFTLDLTK
ncbi:MAG: DUF3332 domain-containing protein [Candidatus Cloacimonas sp.]